MYSNNVFKVSKTTLGGYIIDDSINGDSHGSNLTCNMFIGSISDAGHMKLLYTGLDHWPHCCIHLSLDSVLLVHCNNHMPMDFLFDPRKSSSK